MAGASAVDGRESIYTFTSCPVFPSRRCIIVTHAMPAGRDGPWHEGGMQLITIADDLLAGTWSPELFCCQSSIDRPYNFKPHISPPIYLIRRLCAIRAPVLGP